ncbi:MAG: hypothetical protein ACYC8T_02200 [Myxococcaceae bacterium]
MLVALVVGCGPAAVGGLEDGGEQDDAGALDDAGGGAGDGGADDAGFTDAGTDAGADAGSDAGPADGGPVCPADMTCVTTFPFGDDRLSLLGNSVLEDYSCAPSIDETGPEIVYRVTVPTAGFLSAAVREQPGVDVDVHLLSALLPTACLSRGNFHARADVAAGVYYVVVDTFGGIGNAGGYHVDIGFTEPSRGACALETGTMRRVGDNGNTLAMPATGTVVLEAHLVTQDEPPPYPSTSTEFLGRHYAISQARTGFVMHRGEVWAPLEGGTFYGAGIGSPTLFPLLDESWYVNMYWTPADRPARGTRMIFRLPGSSRAVVVAAGYETGPGDLAKIGGTPEETFYYLGPGTQPWTLGIAVDQTLPYGPRVCQ